MTNWIHSRRLAAFRCWITALAVCLPGIATAQVAAPTLNPLVNPVPFFHEVALNPATVAWDRSRIGVARGELTIDFPALGISPIWDGDTQHLQAAWVGSWFGVDLQQATFDLQLNPSFGTQQLEAEYTVLHAAARIGEMASLGLGRQSLDVESGGVTSESRHLPVVGATVRLADWFYLGAAAGSETVSFGGPQEAERPVQRLGVAARWDDGERGFHLQLYRDESDEVVDPAIIVDAETADGLIAELKFAHVVLGYHSVDLEIRPPAGFGTPSNQEIRTYSVAWTPMTGFSLGLTRTEATEDTTLDMVANSIALAWLF